MKKKLTLDRETLAPLSPADLVGVHGGNANITVTRLDICDPISKQPDCQHTRQILCVPPPDMAR